ncbi:hypothetical protein AVEN_272997-1 [Araneus ventricosus]|uniref:Uncharacterized protein n=1 Tax=Araneus ventricosus TaxID=182803 RepID=A0A4Y2EYZ9_ARAVE|nr:hypothetical protein AVEN_272997-1 [Araneus ventricosus]
MLRLDGKTFWSIPTEPCPKSDSPDFSEFKNVGKILKKDSKVNKDKQNASVGKISDFYRTIKTSRSKVPNSLTTQDNVSTHQSALKPFATTKPNSVDTKLLPMAVLASLEKNFYKLGNLMLMPK